MNCIAANLSENSPIVDKIESFFDRAAPPTEKEKSLQAKLRAEQNIIDGIKRLLFNIFISSFIIPYFELYTKFLSIESHINICVKDR
jgi:hypothetical protein